MRSVVSAVRGLQPMVLAIAATFCAAGLVLYFQHRALSTLDSQTRVILRQINEQTAADIALEVHRAIDGPVFDTLTAVNHPELRAGRLDLVAREFAEGLKAYPHVDRFFVWSAETECAFPGEALFTSRHPRDTVQIPLAASSVALERDPPLGRAILEIAERHAPEQHIYVAAEDVGRAGTSGAPAAVLDRRAAHRITLRCSASSSIPRPARNACSARCTNGASAPCCAVAAATCHCAFGSSTRAAPLCSAIRRRKPRRERAAADAVLSRRSHRLAPLERSAPRNRWRIEVSADPRTGTAPASAMATGPRSCRWC